MNNENLKNKITEMSEEEIGKIFPIVQSNAKKDWASLYQIEKAKISEVLSLKGFVFHHIGSTAIPNIKAKPILDMLIEIPEDTNLKIFRSKLESLDYMCVTQMENPAPNMSFYKGYTLDGFSENVYHLHIRYLGDWDEVRFCRFMINNPKWARAYEILKTELAEKYPNHREKYTNGKSEFIKKVLKLVNEK